MSHAILVGFGIWAVYVWAFGGRNLMDEWKRNLDQKRKKQQEFETALLDLSAKNEALTHLLIWTEAQLQAKTPHEEIQAGLRSRAQAGADQIQVVTSMAEAAEIAKQSPLQLLKDHGEDA